MLCEKMSLNILSNELLVGAVAEGRLRKSTLAIARSASGRGMLVYRELTSYVTKIVFLGKIPKLLIRCRKCPVSLT